VFLEGKINQCFPHVSLCVDIYIQDRDVFRISWGKGNYLDLALLLTLHLENIPGIGH
jgi:hypothetical protein